MKRGFTALAKLLSGTEYDSVSAMMRDTSIELIRSMGGASGVIFGTMFSGGIGILPAGDRVSTETLARYFDMGEQAIEKRGRSKPGEKTMLDALAPAVAAMKRSADGDAVSFFENAWLASLRGVEESRDMISVRGRSSNFGDRCLGLPDPGAMSVSYIFEGIYETIKENG